MTTDFAYMRKVLGKLASLHKNADQESDRQLIEHIARILADMHKYPYDNMKLHLASMWPL